MKDLSKDPLYIFDDNSPQNFVDSYIPLHDDDLAIFAFEIVSNACQVLTAAAVAHGGNYISPSSRDWQGLEKWLLDYEGESSWPQSDYELGGLVGQAHNCIDVIIATMPRVWDSREAKDKVKSGYLLNAMVRGHTLGALIQRIYNHFSFDLSKNDAFIAAMEKQNQRQIVAKVNATNAVKTKANNEKERQDLIVAKANALSRSTYDDDWQFATIVEEALKDSIRKWKKAVIQKRKRKNKSSALKEAQTYVWKAIKKNSINANYRF